MKDYNQVKNKINKNIFIVIFYIALTLSLAYITYHILLATSGRESGQKSFLGYTFRIVVSGSMEPTINTNALAIIKICDIDDIEKDDLVCFSYGQDIIHRVINKNTDGTVILNTQGDANERPDGIEVNSDMVIGKVVKVFNQVAPFISKYSISPGHIDTIALTRNVAIYCVIFVLGIYLIIHIIRILINMLVSIIQDKKESTKQDTIEQYIIDLDELILYREILKDSLEKQVSNNAEHRFYYLSGKIARAKINTECKRLHKNIKEYKHQIKRAMFIKNLGKILDEKTNN